MCSVDFLLSLFQGCLLVLFGRLADLYGRKRIFLFGSFWLAAFSLGCAFAQGILSSTSIIQRHHILSNTHKMA